VRRHKKRYKLLAVMPRAIRERNRVGGNLKSGKKTIDTRGGSQDRLHREIKVNTLEGWGEGLPGKPLKFGKRKKKGERGGKKWGKENSKRPKIEQYKGPRYSSTTQNSPSNEELRKGELA